MSPSLSWSAKQCEKEGARHTYRERGLLGGAMWMNPGRTGRGHCYACLGVDLG